MPRVSLVCLLAAGCVGATTTPDAGPPRMPAGPPAWLDVAGPRLGDLPPQSAVKLGYFQTSDACAQCHTAADGSPALRDAQGRDVSPVALYRASMMSLAARDPYYLASFSHELAARPGAGDAIEATCTRCHCPAADVQLRTTSEHVTFAALTGDAAPVSHLARDGVGCVLCHQIVANGLGTPSSFGGQLSVSGTLIYGRYSDPVVAPMQFYVSYTPTLGAHIAKSELCGSCHTVITRALDASGAPVGPPFYEQAAFLEWQNSTVASTTTCQDCHVPTLDEDGVAIRTPVARPPNASVGVREPVGRHLFVGANRWVLGLLADNVTWSGSATPAAEIAAQATRSEASLAEAARLTIARAVRDGGDLVVDVTVENRTGHKLPTGYPSRRLFVHLTVRDAGGAVRFESGATDAWGRLVDDRGNLVDVPGELHPHRDRVTASDQVQIYESVAGDAAGAPAAHLLDATQYLKDDRLLPPGWTASGPNAAITAPVGTDGDANFGSEDTVTYRVAAPAGALTVEVELMYQSVRPTDVEALAAQATDATRRLFDMVAARPPLPVAVARAEAQVP